VDSAWHGFLLRIGAVSIGIGILLPLGLSVLSRVPAERIYGLIAATLVVEYGAAALGAGIGLGPGPVVLVVSTVALGVTIVLFGFFDALGAESERVRLFLERTRARAGKNRILAKYGIYGLPPAICTIGFYFCPGIAWVLGWDRWRAIVLIMAGYLVAAVITYYAAEGTLRLIGL
jgi:hypothetical protein